jgi:hypothetical protein
MHDMLLEFWENFRHNLFKPLLLFFYMGFSVPLFKVPFEFPHVLYQGLTMYLLIAIGWKGGEELAELSGTEFAHAGGFMLIGFITNFIIGVLAYVILRNFTNLRKVDAATVAGYYGSDSAGTFVTCQGVLLAANIGAAAYMPVMLAVMEIPGCLVALFLVSRLRRHGMDSHGNMPGELGYDPNAQPDVEANGGDENGGHGHDTHGGGQGHAVAVKSSHAPATHGKKKGRSANGSFASFINWSLLHEVFLNPGLFLLFGGIFIGYVSRVQGEKVTAQDDELFVRLFQGALCLFLLEMGMTACKRLKDLKSAGLPFILCCLIGPNIFATCGIFIAHGYSQFLGQPFELGTYALFSVLCAAASYIAVPAIQRLAIPEASPTLPLAASLGLTFSYNVTIGIPVYMLIAKKVMESFPVVAT